MRAERVLAALQRVLFPMMLGTYVIAGVAPRLGAALRHTSIATLAWFGNAPVHLNAPTLLLGAMLFNAGLGVKVEELPALARGPRALLSGIVANAILPIAFVGLVMLASKAWPDQEEMQNLLAGLALVGSMPIAGGSTVWAQNADGNVALSVGLVLASTIVSPFTIPLGLHAAAHMTTGDYAEDLTELARGGSGTFALVSIVIPCVAGMLVRRALGPARFSAVRPWIKLANIANILLLSYTNASGALTEVVRSPDYDLLAIVFVAAAAMCVGSFALGWSAARRLGVSPADAISLTFATGMNNSSASAVLATTALADHPTVLLPILAYSLLQKTMAGGVDAALRRRRG